MRLLLIMAFRALVRCLQNMKLCNRRTFLPKKLRPLPVFPSIISMASSQEMAVLCSHAVRTALVPSTPVRIMVFLVRSGPGMAEAMIICIVRVFSFVLADGADTREMAYTLLTSLLQWFLVSLQQQ